MPKYMAAGRNGGYRDNEVRDRESDLDVSRRDIGYSKGENDRMKNGYRDYEKIQGRGGGSRDRGTVRQKDVKERESSNGGLYRSVSRSGSGSSGSSGGGRLRGLLVGSVDREPGELSSESGSEEATDSSRADNNRSDLKQESGMSLPAQSKKRKFSPIVWDRDEVSIVSQQSVALTPSVLPPPPPPPKSYRESPNTIVAGAVEICPIEYTKLQPSESELPVEPVVEIVSHVSVVAESLGVLSSAPQEQHTEYNEDYAPTLNIRSSRWANDANSPADEGEISDSPDVRMLKKMKKMPLAAQQEMKVRNKLISPELVELKREGSEGQRARSSESDEGARCRSSSGDFYADKDQDNADYMEMDIEHNNGSKIGRKDTDSEDECYSRDTPEPAAPPQRSVNMLQGCRSVDEFERLNKIDEGTYGVVYRAKDKKTGEVVALKKVKMEKEREGFPLTSLREINILLSFDHPSIVDVKEVVVGSSLDSIFMVMEYMEHDLKALMETKKQPFSQSEVKCLMLQLLEGVKYLHDNWVLHRDLKTSNLLLNNRGELKICDFGLARQYGSPLKPYTHLVVTLWYRAPELLLGTKQYSTAIDMWSLGCIMAELLSKEPLFNGKTEFDQIDKIFKMLGVPNETIWPGFSKLPGVKVKNVKQPYNLLRKKFPATSFTGSPVLSDAGFDLLNKLLTYDPEKRITADAALNHEWFREVPLPKSKDFMPTFPAQHAQDRRTRRLLKSPDPLEEQRRKELKQRELGTGGLFG
ncbi:cyclin-dependent kinase G-2 [Daucus carota subsp. sativus]|nr:PREDICTED: cyclin-dependent kinase G-2-like isoform X1 [Daucus carota subsp. sativus]